MSGVAKLLLVKNGGCADFFLARQATITSPLITTTSYTVTSVDTRQSVLWKYQFQNTYRATESLDWPGCMLGLPILPDSRKFPDFDALRSPYTNSIRWKCPYTTVNFRFSRVLQLRSWQAWCIWGCMVCIFIRRTRVTASRSKPVSSMVQGTWLVF